MRVYPFLWKAPFGLRTLLANEKLVVTEPRSQKVGDFKKTEMRSLNAYEVMVMLDGKLNTFLLNRRNTKLEKEIKVT